MDVVRRAELYIEDQLSVVYKFSEIKELLEMSLQVEIIKLIRRTQCESPPETSPKRET
jgi:hypothetical protein